LRLIFSIFTAIVVIAAALFFFGPLLISTDEVRAQLLAQVESATGYRLRVDGPVKFSLFPSLDLVAEDVGVSQSGSAEIATAKELRFGLVWSALWGGKVQLTEVTLIDPVIAVPAKQTQTQAGTDGAASPGSLEGRSAAAALQNLTLDKLVIQNGTVILPPSANTPGKRIEQLMLETSLPSFDGPLSFDLTAIYEDKPVQAAGSIGNFGPFLSGTPAAVSLAVDAPAHLGDKATVAGTATYQGDSFALSQFTAKSGDKAVSGNAIYQNETLTLSQFTAKAFDAVLTGNATYKGNILTLHPFTAKAYGSNLSGSLAADLSGKVPAVNAVLTADTINVNALMAKPGDAPGGGGAGVGGGGAGSAGGSGWSDAKIDFSPLRAVNAKLKLTAQQLIYDNIKISPVSIQATLAGGKLNAELPSFKLYNGAGAASLAVDASGQTPSQKIKLSLAKFDAFPFLKDVANFQNLEGIGTIALDVAASGASQRAMISALSGNTKFDFANGAIRGINIAKTVRNLTQGTLSGWQDSAAEKTDFATLGASFKLASGQAQTSDLSLVGPLVRMSGEGTINLPARTLNLRVNPQIVASLEGQGGKTDLQGLGVPVVISGPWASPRIYPDIKGILENPVAAYEQLNKLNQFGGGVVKLPSLDELGEKAGVSGVPLSNIVKDGKIDRDALQQGAVEGLGQLLNKQGKQKGAASPQAVAPATTDPAMPAETAPPANEPVAIKPPAQPAPPPAETVSEEPPAEKAQTKAEQKKQRKQEQKREAEDAANQLLQNLFGN
jgi:AsmA protein